MRKKAYVRSLFCHGLDYLFCLQYFLFKVCWLSGFYHDLHTLFLCFSVAKQSGIFLFFSSYSIITFTTWLCLSIQSFHATPFLFYSGVLIHLIITWFPSTFPDFFYHLILFSDWFFYWIGFIHFTWVKPLSLLFLDWF